MTAAHVVLSLALLGQSDDKKASLEALQKRVDTTRIFMLSKDPNGDKREDSKLVEKPIFRYSDELRGIEDAAIWLWSAHGRPVAALKVERYREGRLKTPWLYCFASLSSELVRAEWVDAKPFQARQPGTVWRQLDDKPGSTRAARLLQMREMARRFSAELLKDAEGKQRMQMRLLTQPLFRYEESEEVLDGAVFGFTGTGTNPDALLLLDLPSKGSWRFGIVGMTAEGLRIRLQERVYEFPFTAGTGTVFDSWCYFHPEK
jgi:hypothetical protein